MRGSEDTVLRNITHKKTAGRLVIALQRLSCTSSSSGTSCEQAETVALTLAAGCAGCDAAALRAALMRSYCSRAASLPPNVCT